MLPIRTMQKLGWRLLVSVLLLLAATAGAWAQNGFTLERYSAEQSGALATGNGYTLVGATGQADAGGMSGNGFVLAGGFLVGAPLPVDSEPESKIYLPRLGQ